MRQARGKVSTKECEVRGEQLGGDVTACAVPCDDDAALVDPKSGWPSIAVLFVTRWSNYAAIDPGGCPVVRGHLRPREALFA